MLHKSTATVSIENPIAPPTYQLVNNISLGTPKAAQVELERNV